VKQFIEDQVFEKFPRCLPIFAVFFTLTWCQQVNRYPRFAFSLTSTLHQPFLDVRGYHRGHTDVFFSPFFLETTTRFSFDTGPR